MRRGGRGGRWPNGSDGLVEDGPAGPRPVRTSGCTWDGTRRGCPDEYLKDDAKAGFPDSAEGLKYPVPTGVSPSQPPTPG